MPKSRPPYPEEDRAELVRLGREGGRSPTELACEFEPSDQSIANWVAQADLDAGRREGVATDERAELKKLRSENRLLKFGEGSAEGPRRQRASRVSSIRREARPTKPTAPLEIAHVPAHLRRPSAAEPSRMVYGEVIGHVVHGDPRRPDALSRLYAYLTDPRDRS